MLSYTEDGIIEVISKGNQQIKERIGFGDGEDVRVYDEAGRFYGVYTMKRQEGRFVPKKMFLENDLK